MLTPPQIGHLQEELASAKNPLFFYDDDADGLAAFLLLYRLHREGKSVVLKAATILTSAFLRKVEEYNPDKIIILDIPDVQQEFIDAAHRPIFWLDHHQPVQRTNVHYFNPVVKDPRAYVPTTYLAWQVSQQESDRWIAAVGCLADWYWPDFMPEFQKIYPHLLSPQADLTIAVYKEQIGILVKMFFFLLKGSTSDVRKSVSILSRIQSPDEILKQGSAAGKFLYKRFEMINQKYQALLIQAKARVSRNKLVLFEYTDQEWSFTINLANELSALYPQKVIIIARKHAGEMKCSLRAQVPILPALQQALQEINGRGGGHPNACGAAIKEEDWERFLQAFKGGLKDA